MATPRGVAVWLLYLFPLLSTFRSSRRADPAVVAAVCTLLVGIGVWKAAHTIPMWLSLTNRALCLAMLWTTAYLLTRLSDVDALHDAAHLRLVELSRQIITAQETERRNLARELHDEMGQLLTAVHLGLQRVRASCPTANGLAIAESEKIVNLAIQQVREISLNLRPSMLDDLGLVPALRWLIDQARQRTGGELHLDVESCGLTLPPDPSTAAFRFVQAALTNAQRHARAKNIWVKVGHTEEALSIVVRDDGVGFDATVTSVVRGPGQGFGLRGMRERVELLDGRFSISSAPGQGTTVGAEFPLPAEAPGEASEA